jgi:hypothetical protein
MEAWRAPFDELTAFPNRIYPVVKRLFDNRIDYYFGRQAIIPAIGLNDAAGYKPAPELS